MPAPHAQLIDLSQQILAYAKAAGAHSADADISHTKGLNVTVRQGEVETIEHTNDRGLSLTVFVAPLTSPPPRSNKWPKRLWRSPATPSPTPAPVWPTPP
jgi:hypothetical protein